MEKLVDFIKRNKERVVLTASALSFVFFIGGGVLLQQLNSKDDVKKEVLPQKVELEVQDKQQPKDSEKNNKKKKTDSFFLEPSPSQLVESLQEMQNLRPDVAQKKLQSLRVIWPIYFFEIRSEKGEKTALFDVSGDGFGVEVSASFSDGQFAELEELEPGSKVWVGGEIVGADLAGTGAVYLKLEHLDFSDRPPQSLTSESESEKSSEAVK